MLVHERRVARFAGDEDDLFIGRERGEGEQREQGEEEQAFHGGEISSVGADGVGVREIA
jgi:hypothetical protein